MAPYKSKKCGPRTHEENREVLCAVCFTKSPNMKTITPKIVTGIQTFVSSEYSSTDDNIPSKICSSCRNKVVALIENPSMVNTIPKPNYKRVKSPLPCTRTNADQPSQCSVCLVARKNFPQDVKKLLADIVFRPTDLVESVSAPKIRAQCTICLSYVAKGISHVCTKATRNENQQKYVKANSTKSKSKVTGALVKSVFQDQGVSQQGGTAVFKTGGRPLKVTLGAKGVSILYIINFGRF